MFDCVNLMYKYYNLNTKTWGNELLSATKLLKQFSINEVAVMLKKRLLIFIPCGKCEKCKANKKHKYHNRVNSQNKISKFGYLLTVTFSNNHIDIWANTDDRAKLMDHCKNNRKLLGNSSTLSKYHIRNIVRNIKLKLNRYYKQKVQLHYFLCGEYGSNTKRAHYHILLFMDYPIPDLRKSTASDFHYQSKLISSKQFGLYDIEILDKKRQTASYLTKYMSKDSAVSNSNNYNLFEEQQIRQAIKNNFPLERLKLFKNEKLLKTYLILWILGEWDFIYKNIYLFCNNIHIKDVTKQKEFIKQSRGLGITGDVFTDLNNNVLNNYYLSKYKHSYTYYKYLFNVFCSHTTPLVRFVLETVYIERYILFLLLCFNLLFTMLDRIRVANIDNYVFKSNNKIDYNKYKQYARKDIF